MAIYECEIWRMGVDLVCNLIEFIKIIYIRYISYIIVLISIY